MIPMGLIWDLDGTLVDSYCCVVPTVKKFCLGLGVSYDEDYIRDYVIRFSVGKLLEDIAPTVGKDPSWLKEQFEIRNNRCISGIRPMVGARETLDELTRSGHSCFVFTHRGSSCTKILRQTGLISYFSEIVTAQFGFPRKPAPDGILYLVDKYDLHPERCYYVGDRSIDVRAGNQAGIGSILFLPDGSPVVPSGSESYVVHNLREILEIVKEKG